MRSPRLILGLLALTMLAFCLTAAAKLRATPKFDRIQLGMKMEEVEALLGPEKRLALPPGIIHVTMLCGRRADMRRRWEIEEGAILIEERLIWFESDDCWLQARVGSKEIERRGPLERLLWWFK